MPESCAPVDVGIRGLLLPNPPRGTTAPTDASVLPDAADDGEVDCGVTEVDDVDPSDDDVTVWDASREYGVELVGVGVWDATPLDCPEFA